MAFYGDLSLVCSSVGVLHRAMEVLHRAMEVLHRAMKVLHRAMEVLQSYGSTVVELWEGYTANKRVYGYYGLYGSL
jgi:hypothetical protein